MVFLGFIRPLKAKRLNITRFYVTIILIVVPFFTIVFYSNERATWITDLAVQDELTVFNKRLKEVESVNKNRKSDILNLRQDVGLAFRTSTKKRSPINNYISSKNSSVYVGRGTLWQKHNQAQSSGQAFSNDFLDLQLPTLKDYLPHLKYFDGLKPALKIAASRSGVTLVFGIPTVKRPVKGYLVPTLHNLIDNMDEEDKNDSLIIVCIAEPDGEYVKKEAEEISNRFQIYIDSGLLEVIAPPENYYPDFKNLRNTLGDTEDRVRWRTKQNLDYVYLMMYAQSRGTFYVQLEDDILTKPHYIKNMKNFAFKQLSINKDWIVLDFCQLGFIGKMFKSVDLSKLVTFFAIFHNDKPVDWLLDNLIQTKVCRFDRDKKHCRKQKDAVWIHYRPSLFQHVGTHSSLKGKVQKLKDKQFGKMPVHYPHINPPAKLETTLNTYKTYTLKRAYEGNSFFWCRSPLKGDNITFQFLAPVLLERYYFHTGNSDHPDDIMVNATVQIRPIQPPKIPDLIPYPSTVDNYFVIGNFLDNPGVASGSVVPTVGPIDVLRIQIEEDSDNWLVLSEIVIDAALMELLSISQFNQSLSTFTDQNVTENATEFSST